jgi:hypothetical protein
VSDYNRGMMAAAHVLRDRANTARQAAGNSSAPPQLVVAFNQVALTLDEAAELIEWMAKG